MIDRSAGLQITAEACRNLTHQPVLPRICLHKRNGQANNNEQRKNSGCKYF